MTTRLSPAGRIVVIAALLVWVGFIAWAALLGRWFNVAFFIFFPVVQLVAMRWLQRRAARRSARGNSPGGPS
jgi:membrane protein implicated in regulation of membrane protease activity